MERFIEPDSAADRAVAPNLKPVPGATPLELRCIRCGFCLDACPTFRLTGNEADSPRGRIYLMRSVHENAISLDDGVTGHLDSCLGCRACETACPSGVQYGRILEDFRAELEPNRRPVARRIVRKLLLDILTSPSRMRIVMSLSRLLPGAAVPGFVARILTGTNEPVMLPAIRRSTPTPPLPAETAARGEERFRVAVLEGCVMRSLYAEINRATVQVLSYAGCRVVAPRTAGCCGALHLHAGLHSAGQQRAGRLMDSMQSCSPDYIISNSAGCGAALKEYPHAMITRPEYAQRATEFAVRVRDICEFLDEIGIPPLPIPIHARVAYHDACHLVHGQKVASAPRRLLERIEGVVLTDIPECDACCGSAGIYNLTQPETALKLQEQKVANILSSNPQIVAAGNPGCIAWIEQGLRRSGSSIPVVHTVELLARASGLAG